MKKDFSISQGIELCLSDDCYDVHNFYDCSLMSYEQDKQLKISFNPTETSEESRPKINLVFKTVEHLSFHLVASVTSSRDVDEIELR